MQDDAIIHVEERHCKFSLLSIKPTTILNRFKNTLKNIFFLYP